MRLPQFFLAALFRSRGRVRARLRFMGLVAHLLPYPLAMQEIVNGHVDETGVRAIEEAFDQPDEKAPPAEPFEPGQDLQEKRVHVEARRRQHGEADAKQERERGPDRQ